VDFGGFIEQFEASSQLLVTCKEVYNDALSVLYGNNRFIANCFSAALRFNESVGGKATSCVQHLVLHDWVELYQPLLYNFSALQPFTNLKSLCLPTEIQARAPRYPPPCPASGTTIPSKNTRLLPKTLPEIPQTILNLSQAENGLDITLAVVFEMFSLQTFPTNGHVYYPSFLACDTVANTSAVVRTTN
jgi:hypothetical protein